MLIFFFICAVLVSLALLFILPPLFQSETPANSEDARAANLLIYQDQLRELQADLKTGLLSKTQYEQDKEELERRLLEDVGDARRSPDAAKKVAPRTLAYVVAIAIPVAAIIFYFLVGTPKGLQSQTGESPTIRQR